MTGLSAITCPATPPWPRPGPRPAPPPTPPPRPTSTPAASPTPAPPAGRHRPGRPSPTHRRDRAGGPEPGRHIVKSASPTQLLGSGRADHLQLCGHQQRQRDPRPTSPSPIPCRAFAHHLPATTLAWPRRAPRPVRPPTPPPRPTLTTARSPTPPPPPAHRRRRPGHDTHTLDHPGRSGPGHHIAKSASITTFSAPGVQVTYSYLVTNTATSP